MMDDKTPMRVHEWVATGVAITVMVMVAVSSIFILVWPIPDANETLVGQMQGSLWTALGMLVTYYFGSSKSSSEKDRTIKTLADTAERTGAALAPDKPTIPVQPGDTVTVAGVKDD